LLPGVPDAASIRGAPFSRNTKSKEEAGVSVPDMLDLSEQFELPIKDRSLVTVPLYASIGVGKVNNGIYYLLLDNVLHNHLHQTHHPRGPSYIPIYGFSLSIKLGMYPFFYRAILMDNNMVKTGQIFAGFKAIDKHRFYY
jgi:hypothetical protein